MSESRNVRLAVGRDTHRLLKSKAALRGQTLKAFLRELAERDSTEPTPTEKGLTDATNTAFAQQPAAK